MRLIDALRIFLPPLAGAALAALLPEGLPMAARMTAGCMLWMALWWMTEAAPVAATALLPLVLFPMLGIASMGEVAGAYAHPVIFLFLGGFVLALGISRWDLHRRIALLVLLRAGSGGGALLAGFMCAAAMLSMWVSNTATTLMLVPIGLAIIDMVGRAGGGRDHRHFHIALMLGIAYAATIGGVATLIGTPPNAFMAAFVGQRYGVEIGFVQWMMVGLPVTLVMLPLAWIVLARLAFPFRLPAARGTAELLADMYRKLGPMSREERRVALVFAAVALCWLARPLLDDMPGLGGLTDSGIALGGALALFLIPARDGHRLLDWRDTERLPWGILLLFGGGLALAAAISGSGLAVAMGGLFGGAAGLGVASLLVLLVAFIVFFTEANGNLATVATFLPVVAAVAAALGLPPLLLIVPVTLAASCAFMLPVATPPNAIVYSAEKISIPQMMRAGFALNIAAIILLSLLGSLLVPMLFANLS